METEILEIPQIVEEPLQKPKKKRIYTPAEIDVMKANLQRGRDAKKKAREDNASVLDLHKTVIGKRSKAEELAERLTAEMAKIPEPEPEPTPEPVVKLAKKLRKVAIAAVAEKIPKRVKPLKQPEPEPETDSDSDSSVELPPQRPIKQRKAAPMPEPSKSMLRFV